MSRWIAIHKKANGIVMDKLNETFIKRINKIITEEFGINDALDKEATRAAKSIITNINGKDFKWDDESGVYKRYHTEKVALGKKSVKIYVTNYWFKTVGERDSFLKSAIVPLGYVYEANMLFIPLYSVGDVPFDVDDATDTIYHEIEHFFQTSKMGHNFGSAELYAKAKSNIKSRNETTRAIAEIFYMSFPSEQDAIVNGMYGSLKKYSYVEVHKKIMESEAAVWCKKLYKDYNLLKNTDRDTLNAELEKYGKNHEQFFKIATKAIKRFEKKLARTTFKLIKDAQLRDGVRFEPGKLEESYTPGKDYWLTTYFDGFLN